MLSILAFLPILWLIIALSVLRQAAHKACLYALGITILLSAFVWKLSALQIGAAIAEGTMLALWPICLVIIAALFTYQIMVHTGAMEKIKQDLSALSEDKRVIILLFGWCFSNFMEGIAGFGTAIAIPAAMLVAVGVDPIRAVVGCLIVNSTPTAFGSVGVPTTTLASVASLPVEPLSAQTAVLQFLHTFLSPFFLVAICAGSWKTLKDFWGVILLTSLAYGLPACLAAVKLGAELPNILGAICSMAALIAVNAVLKRKAGIVSKSVLTNKERLRVWSPFLLIFVFLLLTSRLCPGVNSFLSGFKGSISLYPGEAAQPLSFMWVNTPGVIIFFAAFIGGSILGVSFGKLVRILLQTIVKYSKTILTFCAVLSMAKIMTYSGMISTLAASLVAISGSAYPFFAPLVGALGGFISGSGTSSSVLFGALQVESAEALKVSPNLLAAANLLGSGIGKMISPQSIAIGASAVSQSGKESRILLSVLPYFLFYLLLAGTLVAVTNL